MAKRLFLSALAVVTLFITSCNRDDLKAIKPAYLSIPELDLKTNYVDEGTAHSKITTVWVFADDIAVGTFELPCVVPVLADGNTKIEVFAGINMNGIDATRAIYTPYAKIEKQISLSPLDTSYLDPSTIAEVNYASTATINIVEDFDQTGQNLVATIKSDTSLEKTNKASEVFINPDEVENNGKAGVIVLDGDKQFFEVSTIDTYPLPGGNRSVYLEMTYKKQYSSGCRSGSPCSRG